MIHLFEATLRELDKNTACWTYILFLIVMPQEYLNFSLGREDSVADNLERDTLARRNWDQS